MKKIIFSFMTLIVMSACKQEMDHSGSVITLTPNINRAITLSLSEIAESVKYIPLETGPNDMIGRIDQLLIRDDRIFILDSKGAKALFIFDINGSLIRKIHNPGSGPEQFQYPTDITIDSHLRRILLYCGKLQKILEYDLDGDFIAEWYPGLTFAKFKWLGDGELAVFTQSKYNSSEAEGELGYELLVINRQHEIIASHFPNGVTLNSGKMTFSFGRNFTGTDKEICFYKTFCDTIYTVSSHSVKPAFIINFGDRAIPQYEKDDVKRLVELLNEGLYATFASFDLTDELAVLTYVEKVEPGMIIFDRRKTFELNIGKISNDIDDGITDVPDIVYDNKMVFINYPEELMMKISSRDSGKLHLSGFESEVDRYDNPLLMFVSIDVNNLKNMQ